jgi:hypothetical protein
MGSTKHAHSSGHAAKRPSKNTAATNIIPKPPPLDVRKIADDFGAGWCMVEVATNSLSGQELGYPEVQVLKRALKLLWPANECLSDLGADLPDNDEDDES